MTELSQREQRRGNRFALGGMRLVALVLLAIAALLVIADPADSEEKRASEESSKMSTTFAARADEQAVREMSHLSRQRAKAARLGVRVATVNYEALLLMNQDYAKTKTTVDHLDVDIDYAKQNGLGQNHPQLRALIADREMAWTQHCEAALVARTAILAAIERLGQEQGWDMIVAKTGAAKNRLGELEGRAELLMAAKEDLTQALRSELHW